MPEKTPEFVTVYHPTIGGVSYDVPAGDVERWVAQHWLKSEPSKPAQQV